VSRTVNHPGEMPDAQRTACRPGVAVAAYCCLCGRLQARLHEGGYCSRCCPRCGSGDAMRWAVMTERRPPLRPPLAQAGHTLAPTEAGQREDGTQPTARHATPCAPTGGHVEAGVSL
jgi:hypothetical protein